MGIILTSNIEEAAEVKMRVFWAIDGFMKESIQGSAF
jgi:hypothetical protein